MAGMLSRAEEGSPFTSAKPPAMLYRLWLLLLLLALAAAAGPPKPIELIVPRGQRAPAPAPAAPKPTPTPGGLLALPSPSPDPNQKIPAAVLTLESALQRSIEGNPDLANARARIEQAYWTVQNAYVPLAPTVGTYVSWNRTLQPPPNSSGLNQLLNTLIPGVLSGGGGGTSPNSYQGAMVFNWTVTTFGRVKWNVLAQKLTEKQTKQDYRTTLESLLQSTEQSYINALQADAQVSLNQQLVANQREYLRLSTNLFKAGQVAEFDVIQSRAQVESGVEGLQGLVAQREAAFIALLILMGADPTLKVALTSLDPPHPPPPSLEEGLARAYERRPELASLRWSLMAAEANALVAAHSNAPSLQLFSQYVSTYVPITPISQNWVVGAQLSVPIYDGGQAYTSTKIALATAEQIRAQLDSQARQVKQDVATAYVNLTNQWRQIQSARRAATENDEALRIAFNRYQAGVGSGTELLGAQENWNNAQSSLIAADASYRLSYVAWRRAISDRYLVAIPPEYMVDWDTPPVQVTPVGDTPDENLADPPARPPSRINR